MNSNFYFRTLFLITILLSIFSCKKDEKIDTLKKEREFVINYNGIADNYKFELIIVSNNQKLLDTVLSTHTEHLIKYNSVDSLVDLTFISKYETFDLINVNFIKTFLSVNPKDWEIFNGIEEAISADLPQNSSAGQHASIHFMNLPNLQDVRKQIWYQSQNNNSGSAVYDYSNNTFDVDGYFSGSFYILVEPTGKYFLIKKPVLNQIVDFNNAMYATKIKYSGIDNSTLYATIIGYTDYVAPYDSFTWVYSNSPDRKNSEYDLIYPGNAFNKYKTHIVWNNQPNTYSIYSFDNTPPATLQFLDDSYLSVTKNSLSEFSVKFNKNPPTFYKLNLQNQSGDIDWSIYAPSTTTTINAKSIYNSLNSKSIVNENIDYVSIKSVTIDKADNLTYQEFWNILFDKNYLADRKISLCKGFKKGF